MFPGTLQVEITNICNARCVMCPIPDKMTRKKGYMDIGLFEKIISQCSPNAVSGHPFLNGEALLCPNVLDYFRIMKNYGVYNYLYTNGSMLTHRLSDVILEEDLVYDMIFSVEGTDKETYEKIRVGLNWDIVRNNILYFIRHRNGIFKTTPKVTVQAVSNDPTMTEKMKGVWGEADLAFSCPPSNFAGQLDREDYKPKNNMCPRLNSHLTVLVDGRCCLCCYDFNGRVIVGDLNKQTIEEVWDGKILNDIRNKIKNREYDKLELCGHCTTL